MIIISKKDVSLMNKYRTTALLMTALLLAGTTACQKNNQESKEEINPAITIEDGQAIDRYSFTAIGPTYSNEKSKTLRFTVYVETDYDTDLDGKNDLVKAFIQLPKEVVENGYKVASIIQASPYTCGTYEDSVKYASEIMHNSESISDADLAHPGSKKAVTDEIDVLTHATACDKSEFKYTVNGYSGYSDTNDCNYFIVRGFAFVNVGGYGTYGSDGIETQGTRLETHAYASVIEWLSGDRIAFSDKEGTHTVKASFSNGNCAVQGTSYLGTTAYALACSNLKGLKTIMPTAGIASWYEYYNNQGVSLWPESYSPYLSYYCASKLAEKNSSYRETYSKYIRYLHEQELEANGDYNDFYERRDYTKNININCPVFIIHGLNDYNVKPQQSVLMYNAIKAAGQNVKVLFHQSSHVSYAFGSYAYSLDDGETTFYDIANKWYCHYLYNIDNGIENYPEVTYQSNIDGKYYTMDNFDIFENEEIELTSPSRETVTSLGSKYYVQTFKDSDYNINNENSIVYDLGEVSEDQLIRGTFKLDINLKTTDIGRDNLMASAVLLDVSDTNFKAYGTNNFFTDYGIVKGKTFKERKGIDGYILDAQTSTTRVKCVTYGCWDLYNPGEFASSGCNPRVELQSDQSYHYVVNFQPTIYKVAKGHQLKLVLFTFDPGSLSKQDEYGKEANYYFKDNLAAYKKWATTEPYSYTIDTSKTAKLVLSK